MLFLLCINDLPAQQIYILKLILVILKHKIYFDFDFRCYGTRQSLASSRTERLCLSFESQQAAKQRREELLSDIESGEKLPKKHAGDFSKVTWDKEGMKREFESYPVGTVVNWSDIARKYRITDSKGRIASNGGQTAKEWLASQGIDVDKFSKSRKNHGAAVRRKKLKGPGGEISFPCPEPIEETQKKLKRKIKSGEYSLGELIVPRKYQKLVVKDGQLIQKIFYVEGSKILQSEIRQMNLKDHEKYMRMKDDSHYDSMTNNEVQAELKKLFESDASLTPDEAKNKLRTIQRTRHLLYWSDGSSLANSGHLVSMINVMYDPAIHYTNQEYKGKTGKHVIVQAEVEKPYLYILARCRSNDEQLSYTDTRVDCIRGLKYRLHTVQGHEILDKMKF